VSKISDKTDKFYYIIAICFGALFLSGHGVYSMMQWLQQLRICSGHFRGGRKSEGDIPVADPDVDDPIRIDVSALTAVKHSEKSPKCRRTNVSSSTAAPTGQKLPASKNSGISLRPNVGLQDSSAAVAGCGGCNAAELYS